MHNSRRAEQAERFRNNNWPSCTTAAIPSLIGRRFVSLNPHPADQVDFIVFDERQRLGGSARFQAQPLDSLEVRQEIVGGHEVV